MVGCTELVGGVKARHLSNALEFHVIVENARLVGVDVIVRCACRLAHQAGGSQRVIQIAPLPIEDVGVGGIAPKQREQVRVAG